MTGARGLWTRAPFKEILHTQDLLERYALLLMAIKE